jgi:hypothetical protein
MNTRNEMNRNSMNMIIGGNGIAVESMESNVTIAYNPSKKQINICSGITPSTTSVITTSIHSANDTENQNNNVNEEYNFDQDHDNDHRVSLWVEGKIYSNNIDLVLLCQNMQYELESMKNELTQLKNMLNEVYYAPGMPGFIHAKIGFTEITESMKNYVQHESIVLKQD